MFGHMMGKIKQQQEPTAERKPARDLLVECLKALEGDLSYDGNSKAKKNIRILIERLDAVEGDKYETED